MIEGKKEFSKLREIFNSFQFDSIENESVILLDSGVSPKDLLVECQKIMKDIGEKFQQGEYYLPELVAAGELFKIASDTIKKRFSAGDANFTGQIVLGTPKGDIHNLGKDIFGVLAEASGFKVHDLGIDVPPEAFIEKTGETGAEFLGMSSLLTTNITSMEETINILIKQGLRESTGVIIGGGATTSGLAKKIGADYQTWDAYEGIRLIQNHSGVVFREAAL
jgi:methanogenic corrinoid protein MtbC1